MSGRREKARRSPRRAAKLDAVRKAEASAKRVRELEAEMLVLFRDADAEPNEAFNVCIRVAARQAMRGGRGQLWFLNQVRIVWNAQVECERGA